MIGRRALFAALALAALGVSAAAQERPPAAMPSVPTTPIAKPSATAAVPPGAVVRKVFGHDMIFANAEAADLAAKGMAWDGNFSRTSDYRKAVDFYAQAVAAQPGAKINAFLANRLAQIYSYTEDPAQDWHPDRAKGSEWWQKCIEASSPKQVLWVEAHIGTACNGTIGRDRKGAVEQLEPVFGVDPQQTELPDWEVWPEPKTERARANLQRELDMQRERMAEAQRAALNTLLYITKGLGRAKAAEVLWGVANRHAGTPAGDYARMLAGREFPGMEPPAPPAVPEPVAVTPPEPEPPIAPPTSQTRHSLGEGGPVAAPLADAPLSPTRPPLWLLALLVAFASLLLIAGVRAILRRRVS